MSTIFIIAGSMLGFMLGMTSLVVGAGLTFAMIFWIGTGLFAALLSVALSSNIGRKEPEAVVQSA